MANGAREAFSPVTKTSSLLLIYGLEVATQEVAHGGSELTPIKSYRGGEAELALVAEVLSGDAVAFAELKTKDIRAVTLLEQFIQLHHAVEGNVANHVLRLSVKEPPSKKPEQGAEWLHFDRWFRWTYIFQYAKPILSHDAVVFAESIVREQNQSWRSPASRPKAKVVNAFWLPEKTAGLIGAGRCDTVRGVPKTARLPIVANYERGIDLLACGRHLQMVAAIHSQAGSKSHAVQREQISRAGNYFETVKAAALT